MVWFLEKMFIMFKFRFNFDFGVAYFLVGRGRAHRLYSVAPFFPGTSAAGAGSLRPGLALVSLWLVPR